jgi:hypothetical protein
VVIAVRPPPSCGDPPHGQAAKYSRKDLRMD